MEAAYKTYWKTWGILLSLTVIMVFVDVMSLPRLLLLVVLLSAMMTKAFLIATEFMDLKHERPIIGVAIAISILFFGTFLFAFIAPDGFAVLAGGR
jgi:cytochrome c oxidase subunit IV